MDAERLRVAEAAAAMAGEEALRAFRTDIGAVRTKRGPHDVVTETDERVERLVAAQVLAPIYSATVTSATRTVKLA